MRPHGLPWGGRCAYLPPIVDPMRRTNHVSMRRTQRLVALAAGLVLVAAACGGDDDNSSSTAAPTTGAASATTAAGSTATTSAGSATTAAAGGGAATTAASTTPATGKTVPTGATAMTITVDLDPKAVWEDGSPI